MWKLVVSTGEAVLLLVSQFSDAQIRYEGCNVHTSLPCGNAFADVLLWGDFKQAAKQKNNLDFWVSFDKISKYIIHLLHQLFRVIGK